MAKRPGLIRGLIDALRGLVGVGRQEVPPSPAEEEVLPPPPPPPRYDDSFLAPTGGGAYFSPGTSYVPAHTQFVAGKKKIYTQTIQGYWTTGNELFPPDISDVRDVLNDSGKSGWVTLVVGGIYMEPYPGQENERVTWLSYVFPMSDLEDIADDVDSDQGNATDWVNELLVGFGEYWNEVFTVKIVDK